MVAFFSLIASERVVFLDVCVGVVRKLKLKEINGCWRFHLFNELNLMHSFPESLGD